MKRMNANDMQKSGYGIKGKTPATCQHPGGKCASPLSGEVHFILVGQSRLAVCNECAKKMLERR